MRGIERIENINGGEAWKRAANRKWEGVGNEACMWLERDKFNARL